jgi:hypothetical protein
MDMWKSLEKCRSEVIDSSSDDESEQTMHTVASSAASIIHKHNANQISVHRSSVKGHLSRDRVSGHLRLYRDYFNSTEPVYLENCSGGGTGCQKTCSWSFYGATRTSNAARCHRCARLHVLPKMFRRYLHAIVLWLLIYSMSIGECVRAPALTPCTDFAEP